jgi:hypothetical protein
MSDRSLPAQPPPPERRDQAVDELCEHFAAGHIELDTLEERLSAVETATSEAELVKLVNDLPALPTVAGASVPVPAQAAEVSAAAVTPRGRGWALAVLGGSSRKGEWTPPRKLHAVAVMGGVELDFRDAQLAAGETHVTAVAVMGGIEIVVPPGLPVTVRGLGILGAVDQVEQAAGEAGPNTPHLKITALACMGGVDVKTQAGSETKRIGSKRNEKET